MKKSIELSIEEAIELYKLNPEYRTNLLSTFTDEELGLEVKMRSWKDLDFTGTYIPCRNGDVDLYGKRTYDNYLSTPSEKHAISMIAFAKLSMLMEDLGSEGEVDWNDIHITKYCILLNTSTNDLYLTSYNHTKQLLAFKSKRTAERFKEKHTELIKQYYGY